MTTYVKKVILVKVEAKLFENLQKWYTYIMTLILSNKAMEEIGKRLREIRESKNLTQLEVAQKARISASYYARVERGVEKPSLAFIEVVTKALNIRSSDILPF